jgi:predicted nicotinamide N-methyase
MAASHTSSPQTLPHRLRDWLARRGDRAAPGGICLSRRHELLAKLQHIGPLRVDRVDLSGAAEPLWIRHTAIFNRLLDNAVYDDEHDYMPYWAEIWPSGVVLAGAIARDPGALRGRRVLELGPGVGVTAVAAMRAGAELVVADVDAGSLALTALNALDQVGTEPRAIRVDWHSPSRELLTAAGKGFPIVLGSDLLYDKKDVRPLVELMERLVAPGGALWLAEPGRDAAKRLVKALRWRGWRDTSESTASPLPDPNYQTRDLITVHRLRRPLSD